MIKKIERNKPIPKTKLKSVEEIKELIKSKNTILIASIKNLPASQFQEICKNLRKEAIVKVPKKTISIRAIEGVGKNSIKNLKPYIHEDIALLFSNLDAFELASVLQSIKTPAKAKAGQEAPEDIVIEPGPTELLPGPAISELGALGLRVAVEGGKISIKEKKVLVKKGDKISEKAAGLMNKLNIKPFSIGFEPLVAYDTKEDKLYVGIKIDAEGALNSLKEAYAKAFGFAINLGYPNEETIKFLIGKAGSHERALEVSIKKNIPKNEEKTQETKSEEEAK